MVIVNEFIENFKAQFLDSDQVIFTEETTFRESGDWDSLTGMSILVMIEDEYKVSITPEELKQCEKISEIISLINEKAIA